MDFQYFQHLYLNSQYDEVKVIGKDVKRDDKWYHILGMTLKDRRASLYVLEFNEEYAWDDEEVAKKPDKALLYRRNTPRQSMRNSIESEKNQNFFMQIREFYIRKKNYETAGASCEALMNRNYSEAMILFCKMRDAGWKLTKKSPFYEADWELIKITNIELNGEFDVLPDFDRVKWKNDVKVTIDTFPERGLVELPVLLECGKKAEMQFHLADGKAVSCYINKIYLLDVWKEQEERFSDPIYIERMLQHVSEKEFKKMKKDFFKVLEEHCPKGKVYMALEYECTEDVSLDFYDKMYLDRVEEQGAGTASAMFMTVRPNQELGLHGLKLRGAVIQTSLDKDCTFLEAELFSYTKMVGKEKFTF